MLQSVYSFIRSSLLTMLFYIILTFYPMIEVFKKPRKDKRLKPHRDEDPSAKNVPKVVTLELHSETLLRLSCLSGNSTVMENDVYKVK